MSDIAGVAVVADDLGPAAAPEEEAWLLSFSRPGTDGSHILEFAVPDAYCAACIATIEAALDRLPHVTSARVNLSTRRVAVTFDGSMQTALSLAPAIEAAGYRTHVLDPAATSNGDPALWELVRATAAAGFAAGNIMLFSVSIWAGADAPTRNLFHWVSALIAIPVIAYAGRPFFRSAFAALRAGRTNMDVPITIGIALATGLSLFETITSGEHAYFDASTMLLFFLLAGRTLDHVMRQQARGALANLASMLPVGAYRVGPDGVPHFVAVEQLNVDDELLLRPGDRVPVDCTVLDGSSDIDNALVSGESTPQTVGPRSGLVAGAVNLTGAMRVRVLHVVADSFLHRVDAMMADAERTRTGYRRLADRVAAIYAPVLHLTALSTFLGWGLLTGDWHNAMINAIAVLIITCPCALALAVPMVQTVAAARLFRNGILMQDGTGLERAAAVDTAVLDKTGTLTSGRPTLAAQTFGSTALLRVAAAIAARSTHGLSLALAAAVPAAVIDGDSHEFPGAGVEVRAPDGIWRLGNAGFCNCPQDRSGSPDGEASRVYLAKDGVCVAGFAFADALRPDAAAAIGALAKLGLRREILSGDLSGAVADAAEGLGIGEFAAQQSPQDKFERLKLLSATGQHTLMVGDGINDAPSLRAAFVSMAPSTASDIGRNAADFVYTNGLLGSVPFTIDISRRALRLIRQNLGIAVVYNALALPLAIAGHVTPLVAALAMSGSSVLVVANALRLNLGRDLRAKGTTP